MADQHLRSLERRHDPEGQVRLLVERLRAGDRDRVELAAYCGHPGARLAVPAPEEGIPPENEDQLGGDWGVADTWAVEAWVEGLLRWGREAQVRAAAAAARVAVERWVYHAAYPAQRAEVERRMKRVIEAAEAWAACPCEEHVRKWQEALEKAPAPSWLPTLGSAVYGVGAVVKAAARFAGERPVRKAIRCTLIEWALSPGAHP